MARVTIDIPDSTHHLLKVKAAHLGVTMKDYMLERILPDLKAAALDTPSLQDMAEAWEQRRKDFKLERGTRNMSEVVHDGHKW